MAQAMSRGSRHPNFTLERPADSHSLVAAAQRDPLDTATDGGSR
jgi:hypothetical protein